MDEVYRGFRISTRLHEGGWSARITRTRGPALAVTAKASIEEGESICVDRSRAEIDRYLNYLSDDVSPIDR